MKMNFSNYDLDGIICHNSDYPDVDCFDMSTLVITKNGIKEIKDVTNGEMMMTRDGSFQRIEKIVDYRNAPVVRVVYGDWYFDCTVNHRLLIKRGDAIEYIYVKDLIRGDMLVQDENTFIPIKEICQQRLVKMVRDLKIENKHCFRVCGRAYNKITLKNGEEYEEQPIHMEGVVVHNSDFSSSTKDSVKDYFAEKYGKENICSIGTIGFLRTKSVLKELGRVYDVPPEEVNELTTEGMANFEPDDEELSFDELKSKFPALERFLEKYPDFEIAFSKLQGTINCWGVHAGGVLISDRPLIDQLPVRVKDGKLVTAWTEGLHSRELGMMGFIKLDILAIETLDIIEESINLINERYHIGLKYEDIPLDEIKCLKRIENNNNLGVFQFETELALKVAKNMGGIDKFEDLAALSTLMRPAALQNGFDKKFGLRRSGEEQYFLPDFMKPYIGKEYGLPIYQEAAYYFANKMADMDKVKSYKFMKLLYKGKMTEDKIPYWKDLFLKGCLSKIKHKEYEIEMEDGSKKTYSEFDEIECTDGKKHSIKDIIANHYEIKDADSKEK